MAFIVDVKRAFRHDVDRIQEEFSHKRALTESDRKIIELMQKIGVGESSSTIFFSANDNCINVHLSGRLTLLDFKTCLECHEEVIEKFISHLGLEKNIDEVNKQFPLEERIRSTSERVLESVTLYCLQRAGTEVNLRDSPVWYALAERNQFLTRPVVDLKNLDYVGRESLNVRLRSLKNGLPDLEHEVEEAIESSANEESLTIEKIALLSGSELSEQAEELPKNCCILFSEGQMQQADFSRFTGEQLEEMISVGGNKEEATRRLSLLSPQQLKLFIKKSPGRYLDQLPDSFYEKLSLIQYDKEVIKNFFTNWTTENNSRRHLQSVDARELSLGFHLLSDCHLAMISMQQISTLDYSCIGGESLKSLFTDVNLSIPSRRKRIQAIPTHAINTVAEKIEEHDFPLSYDIQQKYNFFTYLSNAQCRALNPELLNKRSVAFLFPPFAVGSLYEGWEQTTQERSGTTYHCFVKEKNSGGSTLISRSENELAELLSKNREESIRSAKRFSIEQLELMKPLMPPEVRDLFANGYPRQTLFESWYDYLMERYNYLAGNNYRSLQMKRYDFSLSTYFYFSP